MAEVYRCCTLCMVTATINTILKLKSDGEDADLNAAFASVAEHMGHISEECEKYYCCVPPFQFKEYEVAHIFRYHSRQASENLLKAFEDEERENGPIVEEPGCTDAESSALISAQKTVNKFQLTPEQKDIYIEVNPGTYTVSAFSHEDKIKQTHLVNIQPGQSINLTFDL
ncbi:A-kinase-interacting protein 1 isoform X2 [Hemicordylus capensis]|uniref:A-kinase-interacting protein 1 isoform X2 n=1 Tax=Hemicordylus capensis TaxID=884348 RepID=UPI002303208B|nr:A-kinase-interacting protein 1 isoform X2 [Hemicordylus capensis]